MNTFGTKIVLSALLVGMPLAGAFAQSNMDGYVDTMSTASIGNPRVPMAYEHNLETAITAAEANLQPVEQGFANPGLAARAEAELLSIRREMAADQRANGGQLSEGSYRALSARIEHVQQLIQEAGNG